MDPEEINYRTLREIQRKEQNSPRLSKINDGFYDSLGKYIKQLNLRYDHESNSQKKMLLKDEIQNIQKIAQNIYEYREKKIVLAAVSKARGGNPDSNNLDPSEKKLFDSILVLLTHSRNILFEKKGKNKPNNEKSIIKNEKSETDDINTNPIILISKDLPEFVGTDTKRYNLRKNDIVSLPKDMAEMLSKRKAAKKLEI